MRMKDTIIPRLIAIVGGSGSGKSWLAGRLHRLLGELAARLSLDDFYRDRSHLPVNRRESVNFDDPRAIDWPYVQSVLRACAAGRPTSLPRYDFSTHTRLSEREHWTPRPLILMDGLWLLLRPPIRRLFDLSIFIDCPSRIRLERRIARDVAERGRTSVAVRRQFVATVAPMHKRHVECQARWADVVLTQPYTAADVKHLGDAMWVLLSANSLMPAWMRATFRAELESLLKNHSPHHG
jgi:uridine kinase